MIPIYKPYLPKEALRYAHESLDSSWISSQGKFISMATEKLQEMLNVKYALLLNNGTCAMHLVAKCAADKLDLSEVIVPNNVYCAAWNAFLFDKNWKLYSVECDLDTWNYDMNALDAAIKAHPNAAVLVVHNVGNVINVPALRRKYPGTTFLEDNCEAIFGKYEEKYTGTESYISGISFFANKTVGIGEGGAILTNNEEAYQYAKCIFSQGQSSRRFVHNELGYNYRATNIQAALLLGQLELAPQIIEMKQEIFDRYRAAFGNREDVLIQRIEEKTEPGNWMFGLRMPGNSGYDAAEAFFKSKSIEVRPMFYDISAHKHLRENENVVIGEVASAQLLQKECLILPNFPELTKEERKYIVDCVEEYLERL